MHAELSTTRRSIAGAASAMSALFAMSAALAGDVPNPVPPTSVVVKTIEEQVLSGELASFTSSGGAVLVVNGSAQQIATPELVRISTPQQTWARGPREAVLTLTDGGAVIGHIVGGDEEVVCVETRDLGKIELPLETLSTILTPLAYQDSYRETAVWLEQTRHGNSDQDRVLLTNGDVVSGFVAAVTSEGLRFEGTMGNTVLPHRVVVAVRLANAPTPLASGARVVVSLRSSGRFTATTCQWTDGILRVRMAHGADARIEAERIVSLDFLGGRWEWLSDHQPISFAHTPMLALDWDMALNRNVLGDPMLVANERFHRGIGVHGRTRITYDLKGAYRELVTQFGIDDSSGPLADVDVSILVDGQRRFAQFGVRRGRLHGPVRVDVSRANRVELVTDYGENGDIQDRFDWVEAALIR